MANRVGEEEVSLGEEAFLTAKEADLLRQGGGLLQGMWNRAPCCGPTAGAASTVEACASGEVRTLGVQP